MTAILKIYDKITASNSVSLGITVAATAYTVYNAYGYIAYLDPITALASACAGSALAILAHVYLVHNSEVKNNSERNNVYAALSLTAGFVDLQSNIVVSGLNAIFHSFVYFEYRRGLFLYPSSVVTPASIGFLLTTLVLQIITQNKKDMA